MLPVKHMKIIRAHHLGMCFGVRNAINTALDIASEHPLSILGELVHNPDVVASLRGRGIRITHEINELRTLDVLVTAHGISRRRLNILNESGFRVWDATCPLVRKAQQAIRDLASDGYHPIVIGRRDHVEVRGLTEDLPEYDVVLTESDIRNLAQRPRLGVVAQTTQPIERVLHLLKLLRERFPVSELKFVDTVCPTTTLRRTAAVDLARECDAMVVVGGANSNNTRELADACRNVCGRVYHVERASDLRDEWFADIASVGITAGTSTPDGAIDEVEERLRAIAGEPVLETDQLSPEPMEKEGAMARL